MKAVEPKSWRVCYTNALTNGVTFVKASDVATARDVFQAQHPGSTITELVPDERDPIPTSARGFFK